MNKIILQIYSIGIFLFFLVSLKPWFLTFIGNYIAIVTVIITLITLTLKRNIFFTKINTRHRLSIISLIIALLYINQSGNIQTFIYIILEIIIYSALIMLRAEYKIKVINRITTYFCIILTISLITWAIYLSGINLPHTPLQSDDGWYTFQNYYFFLLNTVQTENALPRFSSVFLEPGHLAMISTFLIAINKFDFKDFNIKILFIAVILSFSLAGYILLIIAYLFYFARNRVKVFIGGACIFLVYLLGINYNDGNNLVNIYIIERLQIEDGEVKGDNRYTEDFNMFYENVSSTSEIITGLHESYNPYAWDGGNSGYKTFILRYGYIGVILLFLFYLSLCTPAVKRYSLPLLGIYIISFIQRPYALWSSQIIIFMLGIYLLKVKFLENERNQYYNTNLQ